MCIRDSGIVTSTENLSEAYDLGDVHGEVTKLVPNTGFNEKKYAERRFNMTKGNIIISFDFFAGQTDGMYSFIMRDTGGMNYAQFALDANGYFVVKRDAAGREYNPPDGMSMYPEEDLSLIHIFLISRRVKAIIFISFCCGIRAGSILPSLHWTPRGNW